MNHHWSISECPSLCRHRPGHSKGQTQSCTKWKTKKNYIHKHGRFWSISIRQKVEGKHLFSEVIFFIMDNMITILFLLTFKAINLTEQRWGVLIKLHNIYLSISNTHKQIWTFFRIHGNSAGHNRFLRSSFQIQLGHGQFVQF